MVARDSKRAGTTTGLLAQLMNAWGGALDSAARASVRVAHSLRDDFQRLRQGDLEVLSTWAPVALAMGCVVAGAAVRTWISPPGPERTAAAIAGAVNVGWAVGRLGLMVVVLGLHKARVARSAWVLGCAAWIVAISPLTAAVAWVFSAGLTGWALGRMGESTRDARISVSVAWGTHAAVSVASWLVVNGWFAAQLT